MEILLMYLWLKLDALNAVLMIFLSLGSISFFFFTMYAWIENEGYMPNSAWTEWKQKKMYPSMYNGGNRDPGPEPERTFWLHAVPKKVYAAMIAALAFVVLLPSSKEAAYMVGAHYAVMASESPEAQKIVTLMRKKANDFLDEQLSEKKSTKKD